MALSTGRSRPARPTSSAEHVLKTVWLGSDASGARSEERVHGDEGEGSLSLSHSLACSLAHSGRTFREERVARMEMLDQVILECPTSSASVWFGFINAVSQGLFPPQRWRVCTAKTERQLENSLRVNPNDQTSGNASPSCAEYPTRVNSRCSNFEYFVLC